MMRFTTSAIATLLAASAANAGGLDRSGQPIGAIFESGTYVEISYGSVNPNVSGTDVFGTESNDVAPAYAQVGAAFKTDLSDSLSAGVIFDQPFGASVSYENADTGYVLGFGSNATQAELDSIGLTFLARYKTGGAFSVHGGLRHISASGNLHATSVTTGTYGAIFERGSGTGYVIGAAYEKPEIAMRVALTYSSAIDVALPTLAGGSGTFNVSVPVGPAGDTNVTTPQSLNLDFQTGVAADTLVFGSVRWVDWPQTEVSPPGYPSNPAVSYAQPTLTYSLGVGRRFSDDLSGALTLGYEASQGGVASDLSPTDGNFSIGLGATYQVKEGVKLTGGVRYVWLGDADTASGATFTNNNALAVGFKIAISM